MRRAVIKLLLLCGVLVLVLFVVDRIAVSVAQRQVSNYLSGREPFTGSASVSIQGIPFISQAVTGRYAHVVVEAGGLQIGDYSGARFRADLRGLHIPVSDALSGQVDTVPVDSATGWIVLPYSELARLTQIDGLRDVSIARSGQGITVRATATVPGLSTEVQAQGTGTARIQDGRLILDVTKASVAGVPLPAGVLRLIADQLDLAFDLPTLPYGLQLASVSPLDDGIRVEGRVGQITLR